MITGSVWLTLDGYATQNTLVLSACRVLPTCQKSQLITHLHTKRKTKTNFFNCDSLVVLTYLNKKGTLLCFCPFKDDSTHSLSIKIVLWVFIICRGSNWIVKSANHDCTECVGGYGLYWSQGQAQLFATKDTL